MYTEEMRRRCNTLDLKNNGPQYQNEALWKHQRLGVDLAAVNRRYNFFYDTRTGKTKMMLEVMYNRLKTGEAKRCVVFCPSAIVKAWLSDAADYPELRVVAFYGAPAERMKALSTPAHIIIWSTEFVHDNLELLKAAKFDICVFDESSKIKSYKAQLSKDMLELSLCIPSWYNLSATPAPNGKHEYYIQMRCIDYYVFSTARCHFVQKYFDDISRNRNYEKLVIKPNMEDEFMNIVNDYSIYVDQKVMPTAGKEWLPIYFDLDQEATIMYKTMCTDMYAEVEGISITTDMAAAMRNKLNQITSGFLIDTGAKKQNELDAKLGYKPAAKEVYRLSNRTRINVLNSLLNNIGKQKVVIWANYAEEFRELYELLGDSARYIRGGTSVEDKEQFIYRDFKKGPIQYLVCHPLSVGMGINLTEAHIAIYYSLNDSWEAFKQSSERICGHIAVQPNKCQYYIILANKTVNELIYDNIINKRDSSTGFMEHLKASALQ